MYFWLRHRFARRAVDRELLQRRSQRARLTGTVSSLHIRFLVDYFPLDSRFCGEAGVSYLVSADQHTVLFDLGYNPHGERPSPLRQNLDALGISPDLKLDGVFISHNHLDHVGGARCQRRLVPNLEQLPAMMAPEVIWTPIPLKRTSPPCRCLELPTEIFPGVISTGRLPAQLYFLGLLQEQALLVDVQGHGLVLISGCGHPGILQMVTLASAIVGRPVTTVIGGLHLIVSRGRTAAQKYLAASHPPWAVFADKDVQRLGQELQRGGVRWVAPSAHDSCDRALDILREIFGAGFIEVRAGGEMTISRER